MALYEGPCYYTNVYYDILDDEECLWTIYSFRDKDVAEQFVEEAPFICSEIEYRRKPRGDDGHLETHPFRPIFTTLEEALADAKEFYEYGSDDEYKYSGRVFRVDLAEIEKQYNRNTIKRLQKENDELREQVTKLVAELKT
jgi:hypothetical protein